MTNMNTKLQLTRTTLRLDSRLKRAAEDRARQQATTLQAIFNKALEEYLERDAEQRAEVIFRTHNLGGKLDNLTRDDYYDD